MKCSKCLHENPDGAKFCIECGAPLEFHCPNCGAVTPATGKFCMECAHSLKQPQASPPIDFTEPHSYTPKHLADKILTNRSAIEGERKLVSVLFADVAGFTAMSEELEPEEVHGIMDGCFKILMDEIHKYEGTINQFTGDGVMALFGAPVAHEDHAQRACRAALAIQNALKDYRYKVEKDFGVDFQMRIGINSGPVVVGSIGDDLRMDYTAVGDTTNLASRMQSQAGPGGILVTKHSYKIAGPYFDFDPLGKVELKGKKEPQDVYRLIKIGEVETRIEASVARGLTRFVGRKKEFGTLMEAFEKVKTGSGQVVGIVGEAGVGKSRILLEFRQAIPESAFTYLEGRCLHFGGSMPYLPILGLLRSLFEINDDDREAIVKKKIRDRTLQIDPKLDNALPVFQDLLSVRVEDETYLKLEPMQKRDRTFEALRNLFMRLSEKNPLIIAIEDLHWIDNTSQELLNYLIGRLAASPILLVLLYRPEYTHPWGSKSYYSKVGMDQLSSRTSAELVQSILEDTPAIPELQELIVGKTGGNPLFMEEFTHSLIENGAIRKEKDRYVLSRNASDIQIPDTIEGIIAARLDRLDDNLKRTMQVASVIGRDFAFRILQTITGMREDLKSHLLNLQGLEFIYEKRLFPELEYIFKHILTQEVAYNSLLINRRKEYHEKIGAAIEDIYPERLEEFYEMLAYHYSKSENHEKTFHYLKLAGSKAVQKYSPAEAFHFYKDALKILKQLPMTEERKRSYIHVCRLLHIPMISLGWPDESLKYLEKGAAFAKDIGDHSNRSRLLADLGFYYSWKLSDASMGIKHFQSALAEAEKSADTVAFTSTVVDLCFLYHLIGSTERIELAEKAVRLLEQEGREYELFLGNSANVYTSLTSGIGYAYAIMGEIGKGKAFCEKGLKVSYEMNHPKSIGVVEYFVGLLYILEGNGDQSLAHYKNAVKYCQETKYFLWLSLSLVGLGRSYHLSGDLEAASEFLNRGLGLIRKLGIKFYLSFHDIFSSMIHYDLKDYGKALSTINNAIKYAHDAYEKHHEGYATLWKGRILWNVDSSKKEEAEQLILQGCQILENLKLMGFYAEGYLYLGELYSTTGRRDKALEYLNKAENCFKRMGSDYWLAKTHELYGRL